MDRVDPLLCAPEYLDHLYRLYREDPAQVEPAFRELFAELDRDRGDRPPAPRLTRFALDSSPLRELPPGIQIYDLVHTFRELGHMVANLDPLGRSERSHPFLDLAHFNLSSADMDTEVSCAGFHGLRRGTVRQHIEALRETYCGPIGVEYTDVMDADRREWLEERMESIRNRPQWSRSQKHKLLRELIAADTFESSLGTMYPGAKRFSLEGATTLIPLLRQVIDEASRGVVEQVVFGMAHRGRLNVLAHVMDKPLEYILAEFEGRPQAASVQGYGDVKYHLGYSSDYLGPEGRSIHLSMAFNPSHLETINPVVEGIVRSKQHRIGDRDRKRVVPLLIHGDAAFAGQGVVAETFTLAGLPGYTTGGTIHVIVNNQVGFTANPEETRSTRYASDIAKIIRAPVFHVNGDHPEIACLAARLALGYRQAFGSDVVIDLICYRRHGHNETDDASFTQPLMSELIKKHPPVSEIYGGKLVLDRIIEREAVDGMAGEVKAAMRDARKIARTLPKQVTQRLGGAWTGLTDAGGDWGADTRVEEARLLQVADSLLRVPAGFTWHHRLERLMQDRVQRIHSGENLDWGSAEALAFGTLLLEGTDVRLSGQDAGRGTFSHRHAIYTDMKTGERFVPLSNLGSAQGAFEVLNSPLSEEAVLGFEYGYSSADPWSLTLWEAQFGDFVNGAQVMIDQLIASAEYKWGRLSGLTMLLPHGYEGQGPEHSSARLERFLELCAENNLQVANLSTPAQLFHALRRQQKRSFRKPLVIMSPKSLLRHPRAVSRRVELETGTFQTAIDDEGVDRARVRRVLLCSGKIYYALSDERDKGGHEDVAIVRLEQLYPYPTELLRSILGGYPGLRELFWVQEEPRNMGAWRHLRHHLISSCPASVILDYVGRDSRAVPATGALDIHQREEAQLVAAAFGDDPSQRVVRREPISGGGGDKTSASAA